MTLRGKHVLGAGLVAAALAFTAVSAKAHVWFDIYGPDARGHTHVHLPYFVSPYYYSSRPHGQLHHHIRKYKRRHHKHKVHERCETWHNRCAANWGHGNANYRGCMAHHGCR